MKMRVLVAVLVMGLSAVGAEKELQLADGRVLRGELTGEQDGQVVLALKVDQITANVRVDKKDILSIKDAVAVQAPAVVVARAPQAGPAAKPSDGDFARVKRLMAEANKESSVEDAVPMGGLYNYGYPYPTWQHWPWTSTIGIKGWYSGYGYGGHRSGHGRSHGRSH